jgi:hypothetical protein
MRRLSDSLPRTGEDSPFGEADPIQSAMRAIYLHSIHRDFADTERLPEPVYLGRRIRRSELKLLACGCEQPALARIRRAFWMRLTIFLRHYLCRACGNRVLRTWVKQRAAYCAIYLPPRPASPDLTTRLRKHYERMVQAREGVQRGDRLGADSTVL